jgi:4-hydroxy-tetrahydrodipicolinate synthase
MTNISHSSRRNFLEKLTTGTLGLTLASGLTETLLANPLGLSGNANGLTKFKSGKKLVPVMVTGFKSNGKIDFDMVSRITDFYLAAGAKGLFANCLSSEMYFLTPQERLDLTRHVVKYVNGAVPVVSTGSFGETMKEKAEFTKKIYDTGVHSVILITSHFANKEDSDDVLIDNFGKFFDMTGNIPLGTYECPSPYKRVLSPKVFQFLVANDRLLYHKDTCENIKLIEGKLAISNNTKLEFYDAHTGTTMLSLQKGAKGMSPVSANFYPEILAWMCENATNPDKLEEVKWMQSEITRTELIIGKGYPISSKYFLQKRGLPIDILTRSNNGRLSTERQEGLNEVHKTFLGWCERLGITPVKA